MNAINKPQTHDNNAATERQVETLLGIIWDKSTDTISVNPQLYTGKKFHGKNTSEKLTVQNI